MMVSTRGRYALRAVIDLAEHCAQGAYVPLADIAARQGISEKYLESIAAALSKAGVVVGVRGKGGGYRLAGDPGQCRVIDVLRATEGSLAPVACLACEQNSCERAQECPTLPVWEGLGAVVDEYLAGITIGQLMRHAVGDGEAGCDEGALAGCPARFDDTEAAPGASGVAR